MQRLREVQFKFTLQNKSTRFNFFKICPSPLPSFGVEFGTLLKIAKKLSSVRSHREVVPALIKIHCEKKFSLWVLCPAFANKSIRMRITLFFSVKIHRTWVDPCDE